MPTAGSMNRGSPGGLALPSGSMGAGIGTSPSSIFNLKSEVRPSGPDVTAVVAGPIRPDYEPDFDLDFDLDEMGPATILTGPPPTLKPRRDGPPEAGACPTSAGAIRSPMTDYRSLPPSPH